MGKRIIIKGADFSENGMSTTLEERLVALLNNNVFHRGIVRAETLSPGRTPTNISGILYTVEYNGDKKISINNGGLALSSILNLGITKVKITPKNNYRFNTAIGNSINSIICDGTWEHLTSALTIDFTNFHSTDWTEVTNCELLLCVVQKSTDETELLDLDFSKYLDFECNGD